jgi:hypothetical protein
LGGDIDHAAIFISKFLATGRCLSGGKPHHPIFSMKFMVIHNSIIFTKYICTIIDDKEIFPQACAVIAKRFYDCGEGRDRIIKRRIILPASEIPFGVFGRLTHAPEADYRIKCAIVHAGYSKFNESLAESFLAIVLNDKIETQGYSAFGDL